MRQDELTGKLTVAENDVCEGAQFVPLFQRLTFDLSEKIPACENEEKIPYDFFCPSIKD